MKHAPAIAILETVAAAAERGEPLPPALRDSGLPDGATLAAEIEAGRPLVEVLHGRVPERIRAWLTGPRPSLAEAALLGAEELRMAVERRAELVANLAYPVLCLIAVLALALVMGLSGAEPRWRWLWVAAPPIALLIAAGLPLPPWGGWHWLVGWRAHAAARRRYARAALAARWRLDERRLDELFGPGSVTDLLPLLGTRDAETHCRLLRDHHAAAARRGARRLTALGMVVCYLVAGGLALAAAAGTWSRLAEALQRVEEPAVAWREAWAEAADPAPGDRASAGSLRDGPASGDPPARDAASRER